MMLRNVLLYGVLVLLKLSLFSFAAHTKAEVASPSARNPTDLGDEHEGNYRLSSMWQNMRIRTSTNTIGTHQYVCPSQYVTSKDWSYDLKESWEWCGAYCKSQEHNNYATDKKVHAILNVIIPKAVESFLERSPLIRGNKRNLVLPGPDTLKGPCKHVTPDKKFSKRGFPNTDVVIYFSISPFPRAERELLTWSESCHLSDGRVAAAVININPCWILDNIEKTTQATANEIAHALNVSKCPEKKSIMLHDENGEESVIVCVQVKCKRDKTFQVRFKDKNWMNCQGGHVLGNDKLAKVMCPTFEEVCEGEAELDTEKDSDEGGHHIASRNSSSLPYENQSFAEKGLLKKRRKVARDSSGPTTSACWAVFLIFSCIMLFKGVI